MFNNIKELLDYLRFDSTKLLFIACDASPCGVGSFLVHTMDDGENKYMAYHFRCLSATEKNYAQDNKEDVNVIKFHKYLWVVNSLW